MTPVLGALAGVGIGAVALLHVYWAVGGHWPGHDLESLARTVVGGPTGMRMPGPLACLIVAALLSVVAFAALVSVGLLEGPGAGARVLTSLGGGALVLRGVAGFFEVRLRPEIVGTPYAGLNVRVYSPLALSIGGLALAAGALG